MEVGQEAGLGFYINQGCHRPEHISKGGEKKMLIKPAKAIDCLPYIPKLCSFS